MKIIKDIRLFTSYTDNIDNNPFPQALDNKELNIVVKRIVMKLREHEFSLSGFDHLYLNFTTCLNSGESCVSKRSADPYHPWYKYHDIGISCELFRRLNDTDVIDDVLDIINKFLTEYFKDKQQLILSIINEVKNLGEKMLMKFKEKNSSKTKATIYLRLLNSGYFYPLLRVTDLEGTVLLEENLKETLDLSYVGEIQLSSKKVTIKPKKNALTSDISPISYSF